MPVCLWANPLWHPLTIKILLLICWSSARDASSNHAVWERHRYSEERRAVWHYLQRHQCEPKLQSQVGFPFHSGKIDIRIDQPVLLCLYIRVIISKIWNIVFSSGFIWSNDIQTTLHRHILRMNSTSQPKGPGFKSCLGPFWVEFAYVILVSVCVFFGCSNFLRQSKVVLT